MLLDMFARIYDALIKVSQGVVRENMGNETLPNLRAEALMVERPFLTTKPTACRGNGKKLD
jgi:hypothetical protein